KEVGKTALVNAMAGQKLSDPTGFGRGTEIAIAYVHESQADAVRAILEREAAGKFRIVTHSLGELRRQVLLDLPDIDSVYRQHVDLTRRMLRHMLFPVWVQSVEKYADQQPQKLLAAVAAGNDPANLGFCLNKVDQVEAKSPPGKAGEIIDELRHDYAARIARVLRRTITPADVHMISAARPETFEFPRLREKLAQQKSSNVVK